MFVLTVRICVTDAIDVCGSHKYLGCTLFDGSHVWDGRNADVGARTDFGWLIVSMVHMLSSGVITSTGPQNQCGCDTPLRYTSYLCV